MSGCFIYLFFVLYCCFFLDLVKCASVVGEEIQVSTHLGSVAVRIVGKISPGVQPVICIPGISKLLINEWVNVAEPLSKRGYVSAIINFHSNQSTKPKGGIEPSDISKIIIESIMEKVFHTKKVIIMGKSWGGFIAYSHAIAHPETVLKLVLLAPAQGTIEQATLLSKTRVPTFLGWARDDTVIPFPSSLVWVHGYGSKLLFYSADSGGHAVLEEYAEPIDKFLALPIP
jgi:hypothetical protein